MIHGRPVIKETHESITLMPVEHQIKTFFELPNVLKDALDFMEKFECKSDDKISHFVQGKLWKSIKSKYDAGSKLIPLLLYSDDFSPDNVLSGNSNNKQCSFQYTFPVFPQHLLTSTEYVFEALLFPSKLKSLEKGLEKCLSDLVNILKKLEDDGLVLNINEEDIKVYFVMSLKIGDNLDLNEMLGFQKSFNANSFCRFCRTLSAETKYDVKIRKENLRNELNYAQDLEKNDPKATGIQANSIFNKLRIFHVTRNFYCDMMHDLWEGVCKYVVCYVLNYFIYTKKKFSLSTFNNLKNQFDYGEIEIGNISNEISEPHIKNTNINMTSSQMKTLMHFLPLMIGSLIKEDDEDYSYWRLILELQEIIDYLLLSEFSSSKLKSLSLLITRFLKHYINLFGPLKPKFHFLLHYPQCILEVGPLRNLMCFVYEQKNRQVKAYSNVMNQRINLSSSLSFKSSMRFSSLIRKHELSGFPLDICVQSSIELSWSDVTQKSFYTKSQEYFHSLSGAEKIREVKKMIYKKAVYKNHFHVILKGRNENVKLYKIIGIISVDDEIKVIAEETNIIEFSKHLRSYKVGETRNIFKVISLQDIKHLPLNLHVTVEGNTYFRIKNI